MQDLLEGLLDLCLSRLCGRFGLGLRLGLGGLLRPQRKRARAAWMIRSSSFWEISAW